MTCKIGPSKNCPPVHFWQTKGLGLGSDMRLHSCAHAADRFWQGKMDRGGVSFYPSPILHDRRKGEGGRRKV